MRTVFLTLSSCSSHPSSSSAGEHGSTPKGPDKKRRRRPTSAQDRVTKAFKAERTWEWIEQQFPSAQDQVVKPLKAEQIREWAKQQSPSAQDQVTKPPEAKQKLEQQPLSAQGQAANPPKAKRNLREWVEQHLPSRLLRVIPLEKFLNDKHGDQYRVEVCLSFPRVLLFVAPVSPLLDAI